MSKLKVESYLEGESLFSALKLAGDFPFIGDQAAIWDAVFLLNYGERIVFNKFENVGVDILAEMLTVQYQQVWNSYIEAETALINPNKRREVTEVIDTVEDRTGNSEDVNKVSGFNSVDMVDNDGSVRNSTDGLVGERERVLTDEEINPEFMLTMLDKATVYSIIKRVMSDISNTITLDIY